MWSPSPLSQSELTQEGLLQYISSFYCIPIIYQTSHKERSRAVLKLKVNFTKKYRQIWTQCTSMWCSRFMMGPYALRTFQQTSSSIRHYTMVHINKFLSKVRFSIIGCVETICRWTIQTDFFSWAEQKSQQKSQFSAYPQLLI